MRRDWREAWARLGNGDELKRICKAILGRPRQGYPVAMEAEHIIRAHVDHWRLDSRAEAEGTRKNRSLLKTGPKVMQRLDDALCDMIDLHQQAETGRWYGKRSLPGKSKGQRLAPGNDSRNCMSALEKPSLPILSCSRCARRHETCG